MICRIATEEKEPKQKKKKQKKKEKKEKREEEKEGEERREKREEEKEEEEEEEEEIGGYVVCKLKKTGEGIDITSLAVRERHRGGGVGRDLILFTVNDAHFTLGVSNAVLHVEHSNLGARRFFFHFVFSFCFFIFFFCFYFFCFYFFLILFTVNDAHFTLGVLNAVLHVEHSNLGARRFFFCFYFFVFIFFFFYYYFIYYFYF